MLTAGAQDTERKCSIVARTSSTSGKANESSLLCTSVGTSIASSGPKQIKDTSKLRARGKPNSKRAMLLSRTTEPTPAVWSVGARNLFSNTWTGANCAHGWKK